MSRIKLSENLFLEVAELNRMIKFLSEDGYKLLIKSLVKKYGIVEDDGGNGFKVTLKPGTLDTIVVNPGLAFTPDLDAIVLEEGVEFQIQNTGMNRWLIISRGVSNIEEGVVTINADGSIDGTGTKFTEVLRGQPNFPTKVRFQSSQNTEDYEVVSVVDDRTAILVGEFIPEQNLKYSVIGTFTPGFQPLDENKTIYEYDSCSFRIVDSESKPSVEEGEFIIAEFTFDGGGGMTINDERVYNIFNDESVIQGQGQNSSYLNPLASLLQVGAVGGIRSVGTISVDLELILEHGYTITNFETITTSAANIFNIISGSSNFLGSGEIPDGMFKDWLLVNRRNMRFAKIDNNINKSIYVSIYDPELVMDSGNDLIIVPDFKEVEYEIKLSSNVNMPSKPFYFKYSIWNACNRARIYSLLPSSGDGLSDSVSVEVKYRMIDNSGRQYPFSNLSTAQFINVNGQYETLGESSFNVNLSALDPESQQRNYS